MGVVSAGRGCSDLAISVHSQSAFKSAAVAFHRRGEQKRDGTDFMKNIDEIEELRKENLKALMAEGRGMCVRIYGMSNHKLCISRIIIFIRRIQHLG